MEIEAVDLGKGLTEERLDQLIGKRDHLEFLNTRNEMYKELEMKTRPPSRSEAIRLMSKYPNLVRRPLLVRGNRVLVGFEEAAWEEVTG